MLDRDNERAYRETVIAEVFKACTQKINEMEKFGQRVIEKGEIVEILNAEVKRISDIIKGLGHQPVTLDEKNQIFHRLSQRGVEVGEGSVVLEGHDAAKPWLRGSDIRWVNWDNYESMLLQEGKSRNVIDEHRLVIDRALDLAGDPKIGPRRPRKGLIMGNVQSGKTLNFIGLINKALDVGYHSIIVLGGHMNELRRQAQSRIDDGVINLEELVDAFETVDKKVHSLTDENNDFNRRTLRGRINLASAPGIYVIKKNVSILKTVLEEIQRSQDRSVLKLPMLLIDDEADYASINTKFDADEYSSTNQRIRDLLDAFETATYVAYTATPFANVFIPYKQTVSGEFDDDLFPSDFMIRMPTPENYRGQEFFFPAEGELGIGPCRRIDPAELWSWLPLKHRKDHEVIGLMPQLEEALHHFVLAIAIRQLRGQTNKHNTMLVNVSRFNDVQKMVAEELFQSVNSLINQCRSYGGLGPDLATQQSPRLRSLRDLFDREFSSLEFEFDQVLGALHKDLVQHGVEVELVNGLAKKSAASKGGLSYESHEENGYWVIAVGGLKLSRGLTLEGLTTSFFARNAMAYDTLTQMCRWFGYRDGYEDVCRLYLLRESWEHYCEVSNSIRELDDELKTMKLVGGTPSQFGLKVQTSDTALMITAKNKLGTARTIDFTYRLWADEVKALRSRDNVKHSQYVMERTLDFIDTLNLEGVSLPNLSNGSRVFAEVEYSELAKFLADSHIPLSGRQRMVEPVVNALSAMDEVGCAKPMVILFSRGASQRPHSQIKNVELKDGSHPSPLLEVPLRDGSSLNGITRTMSERDGEIFSPNVLIGDGNDLSLVFDDVETNAQARERYLKGPLLVMYFYRALLKKGEYAKDGYRLAAEEQPIHVGYRLHFPSRESVEADIPQMETNQKYLVNEVFQESLDWGDAIEEDEE